MLKRAIAGIAAGLAIGAVAAPVWANAVIDFGTGSAGTGGTVSLYADSNLSGTDIPVATVTIVGAPAGNGTFAVAGTTNGSALSNVGTLSFNTGEGGSNFIQISGTIPTLGLTTPELLLSGTVSSFDTTNVSHGLVAAVGPDSKAADLLAALGLAPNTQFQYFAFSIATNILTLPAPGQPAATSSAISTDIRNTAVPEPSSLLLLGAGLLGVATLVFRHRPAIATPRFK